MIVILLLALLPASAVGVPPGTAIENTAEAQYRPDGGDATTVWSETVSITTTVAKTPSKLEYLRYVREGAGVDLTQVPLTEYSQSGSSDGPFALVPPPSWGCDGDPLPLGGPVALAHAGCFRRCEPLFVRLIDRDQNADPETAEAVLVGISVDHQEDRELLRLREVGPDAGVFVGYIGSLGGDPATMNDGLLTLRGEVTAEYVDVADPDDRSSAEAPCEAASIVFDSATGRPVDGATVTLLCADSGDPAVVRGDDGVSAFPSTILSGGQVTDAGGALYDLPPGGYRFPSVEPGTYRVAVVPPEGHTAPSSVSIDDLESLPNGPFALADPGSHCGPFEIADGPICPIDIPVDPIRGPLFLAKTASATRAAIGEHVIYTLRIENVSPGRLCDVRIDDRQPSGFRYCTGSCDTDGAASPDPTVSSDGRTLTFAIGELAAGATATLRYVTEVCAGARSGRATNRAVARGAGGAVSNEAEASLEVTDDLLRDRCVIVGRVAQDDRDGASGGGLGMAGVRIYLEDGTYAVTDEHGLFHFEGVPPGVHVVEVDLESVPDTCRVIARGGAAAHSQFVDLQAGTLWRADFDVRGARDAPRTARARRDSSGTCRRRAGRGRVTAAGPRRSLPSEPAFDAVWIETVHPGLECLWPTDESHPPIPSLKVVVKHRPQDTVSLSLNGSEVSWRNFDTTIRNSAGTAAASRWRGVDLAEGDNHIEIIARDQSGRQTGRLERVVHFSGPPVHAEFVASESSLVADGTTSPVIAVLLTDGDRHPAREGITGSFSVDPPYAPEDETDKLSGNPLSRRVAPEPRFVTGEDGIARIVLTPTTKSGEAVLRLRLANGEHELRAWLVPEERDWILVGLAEGTVGYKTVRGHAEDLDGPGDDYYRDGRIALFARGRIRGDWLLTLSADTENRATGADRGLFRTIDPGTYYTLYGDATEQGYDAASAEKIYVRIEREHFYALFGDFDTGLTVTELSRYSRAVNGWKSELQTGSASVGVFASETSQAFARDEIPGDGTSGLYRLSRPNVVANTERVVIETRERLHSEVIISSRWMTRHMDYDIDYGAGTLFFKEPIPSQDAEFNPVFIVVDYETYGTATTSLTYGGRGAAKLLDRALEVGVTRVHEGEAERGGDLTGADVTIRLGRSTEVRGELARTRRILASTGAEVDGDAYLAELAYRSGSLNGRLYARELDETFGLGQQNAGEAGTRKVGADVTHRLRDALTMSGRVHRQRDLVTGSRRDLGEAKLSFTGGSYTLTAGLRHAEDNLPGGAVERSDQITGGASSRVLGRRLLLRAGHEQSLGGRNANPAFPTRTTLGAEFEVNRPVTLFAEHELTHGRAEDTERTRLGAKAKPWSGGLLSTSLVDHRVENADRLFANLGLKQTWRLDERWTIDAGLDHGRTLARRGSAPETSGLPSTAVGGDFTAASAGAAYGAPTWSWTSRLEHRSSEDEDRWNAAAGINGEPVAGLGLFASTRVLTTTSDAGPHRTHAALRLGFAYRPPRSRWTVLDRMDLALDEQRGGEPRTVSRRIVNNLNANWYAGGGTQVAFQYGGKYVRETLLGARYDGYTDLAGFEIRYDITDRWDVGAHGSRLRSWGRGQVDYGAGASLGCNVFENVWLSVGYNVWGFEDEDFSESGFTARGPFVRLRLRFDQTPLRRLLERVSS